MRRSYLWFLVDKDAKVLLVQARSVEEWKWQQEENDPRLDDVLLSVISPHRRVTET